MNVVQRSIGLGAVALGLAAAAGCAGPRRAAPPATVPAGPAGAERRAFAIPGHGAIELPVPRGWVAEAAHPDGSGPVTIRLEQPGGSFVALLTPFFNPGDGEGQPNGPDTARLFADLARRNAMPGAVEAEVPLQRLAGPGGVSGFWFAATDRSLAGREPGPEEWRHVVQGAAAVGPLVVAFTLLDNADGPQRETVLEIIGGARHLDRAAPQADARRVPELEPDPEARTVPLRVEVAGKAWAVLVDLPGFHMFKPRRSDDGTGVLVLGEDPRSGVIASVILRPAAGAQDAGACRDTDLPRIRDAAPELAELRVVSTGASARASYVLAAPGGAPSRQRHGHAWLEREGICANVHVSKVDPDAGDGAQMERILASVRFGEDL
jgi:hypothetical protein